MIYIVLFPILLLHLIATVTATQIVLYYVFLFHQAAVSLVEFNRARQTYRLRKNHHSQTRIMDRTMSTYLLRIAGKK